ncbi:MAG TPA: hypothetical protein VN715_04465 [Roseiarcus sp.]|nr:hypothetical protein [Roseiarcus sp.]
MNTDPFLLFLRWLALGAEQTAGQAQASVEQSDPYLQAAQHLTDGDKKSLLAFIDKQLSEEPSPRDLARLFEDGHLHFVWKKDDGPKMALRLIRDVVVSALDSQG